MSVIRLKISGMGYPGNDGARENAALIETAQALSPGTPVFVNPLTNRVGIACADSASRWTLIGCSINAFGIGSRAEISLNNLTLTDWTLATGAALLTPGAIYWLNDTTPGLLTVIPQQTLGKACVVAGRAASTTTLVIAPEIYSLT